MPEPEDEVERIIANAIQHHGAADPMRTMRAIIDGLWSADYEVTHQPDLIPIRRNPRLE